MKPGDLVTMPGSDSPGMAIVLSETQTWGGGSAPRSRTKVWWIDENEVCSEPTDWLEVVNYPGEDND